MVELSICPLHGVVASFTGGGEARRNVGNRTNRVLIILQVTRDTRGVGQVVIVVNVTIGALARRDCVGSGEWEPGAVVIESGILPRSRIVALLTRLRKVLCDVVWVARALIILEVAGDTSDTR